MIAEVVVALVAVTVLRLQIDWGVEAVDVLVGVRLFPLLFEAPVDVHRPQMDPQMDCQPL